MANQKTTVIGLGYVGLPLAVALARSGREVVGFDTNADLVARLNGGHDPNGEVTDSSVSESGVVFSSSPAALSGCTVFIVAVPTPIDQAKTPDLSPILSAAKTIAPYLEKGALVILESTVYPGVTEEVLGPELARLSGLTQYDDFRLAYSPERINPGDAEHSLQTVVKVISAQDDATLDEVDAIYAPIVRAGLHRASSIRTAEAAKVIENTQRDLNIALVNEFSLIFNRLGLDTLDVLEAAGTKWNFLPFRPGLVGGHCIGVDPYYLTYRAEKAGYHPQVILAGRRINDNMGRYVARELIKAMLQARPGQTPSRVLVMGFTFKENCADTRNSRVADIVEELREFALSVDIWDPWVDSARMEAEFGYGTVPAPENGAYDGILLAVPHQEFLQMEAREIRALGKPSVLLYDIKGALEKSDVDLRL